MANRTSADGGSNPQTVDARRRRLFPREPSPDDADRPGRASEASTHDHGALADEVGDVISTPPDSRTRRLATAKQHQPLEEQCAKVLALLRKHCPEIVPPGPVPPGDITPPIDVETEQLDQLVLAAIGVDDKRGRHQVIWEQAGAELLVHLKRTRVAVLDGLLLVGVTVESNETGRAEVTVPFAVGREERLAGMVVATEPVPRGPAVIVDRWGESLIAFAWQIVVDVVNTLCARVGVDTAGTTLVPGAIVARTGEMRVIPQARHEYERPLR